MQLNSLLYVIPLFVAGLIAVGLSVYVARRRDTPGGLPVTLVLIGATWWSLLYAGSVAAVDPATKLLFEQLALPGRVLVPVSWFLFALEFSRHEKVLQRPASLLLWIVPAITVFLGWTNDAHGLFWRNIIVDTSGPIRLLDLRPGVWYWIYTAYAYLLTIGGIAILLRAYLKAPSLYRAQAVWLVTATIPPLAANFIQILGFSPVPHLTLAPFGFVITGLALARGLYSNHLLDVVPVAHRAAIAGMNDAVIVLDPQDRVIDLNPATETLTGCRATEALRLNLAQ